MRFELMRDLLFLRVELRFLLPGHDTLTETVSVIRYWVVETERVLRLTTMILLQT